VTLTYRKQKTERFLWKRFRLPLNKPYYKHSLQLNSTRKHLFPSHIFLKFSLVCVCVENDRDPVGEESDQQDACWQRCDEEVFPNSVTAFQISHCNCNRIELHRSPKLEFPNANPRLKGGTVLLSTKVFPTTSRKLWCKLQLVLKSMGNFGSFFFDFHITFSLP